MSNKIKFIILGLCSCFLIGWIVYSNVSYAKNKEYLLGNGKKTKCKIISSRITGKAVSYYATYYFYFNNRKYTCKSENLDKHSTPDSACFYIYVDKKDPMNNYVDFSRIIDYSPIFPE